MDDQTQLDEHAAVDGLLPWFVNNTLAPDERDRVRRHLGNCAACRSNISLLSVVQSTVRHATTTPIVPPPRTDRFLETIAHSNSGRRHPRPSVKWALVASLAAAVPVAALLLPDRDNPVTPPVLYETATSTSGQVSMGYVLDVQFERDTPLAVRQRVLRGLQARNVRDALNRVYRVTVTLPAASLEELEEYTSDIESLPGVERVRVVALELPMKRSQ